MNRVGKVGFTEYGSRGVKRMGLGSTEKIVSEQGGSGNVN